jgi:hypothetical protein
VGCSGPARSPCDPLPHPAEINDDVRDKAMLSVTAHSVLRRVPEEWNLYSLPAAFGVLAADRDRLAPLRLRRAVAKVVAYRPPDHDVDCLLRQVGVDLGRLSQALQVTEVREIRETIAFNEVANAFEVDDCKAKDLQIHVIDANPTFTVTSEAWVSRSRDMIAKILDPQSWDDCSTFWRRPQGAFLIDLDSMGQIPPGPPTEGTPEVVGVPYLTQPRVLFEHFRCLADICSFELYLNLWTYMQDIVTPIAGSAYHVWYVLRHQRSGTFKVFGNDVRVGIDIDQGLLQAVPDPAGGTRVYTSKTLRYDSAVKTEIAEKAAAQYQEFAGKLADMLCCRAPL